MNPDDIRLCVLYGIEDFDDLNKFIQLNQEKKPDLVQKVAESFWDYQNEIITKNKQLDAVSIPAEALSGSSIKAKAFEREYVAEFKHGGKPFLDVDSIKAAQRKEYAMPSIELHDIGPRGLSGESYRKWKSRQRGVDILRDDRMFAMKVSEIPKNWDKWPTVVVPKDMDAYDLKFIARIHEEAFEALHKSYKEARREPAPKVQSHWDHFWPDYVTDRKKEERNTEGKHNVNHSLNRNLNDLVKGNTAGATIVSTPKLTTLKAFAGKTEADEYKNLTSLPESVKVALDKKIKKQQEESADAAADQIIGLLKANDGVVETHVEAIRSLRKRIEAEKTKLAKVNLAKAYALETNNYIPLAAVLGQLRSYEIEEAGDLAKVPENWAPAPAA